MKNKQSHIHNVILSVVFLLMLAFPMVGGWFSLPELFSIDENRRLAPRPIFNLSLLDPLPNQVNQWYADHFYGRSILLRSYEAWKPWLGNINATPDKVIIGKDHWLFLGETSMNQYLGQDTFETNVLAQIRIEQTQRAEWLKERGILYYLIIAPNKQSIYPEYLPDHLQRPGVKTQLDQIATIFENDSLIRFLNLRPRLIEKKGENPLYLLTDTHWNDLGAFYAYQAISDLLKIDFMHVQSHSLKEMQVKQEKNFLGNLARMAVLNNEYAEPIPLLTSPNQKSLVMGKMEQDPLAFIYPQYNLTTEIQNTGDSTKPKVLIIKDSFTTYMAPWLSEHFGTSIYLWDNWTYQLHKDIIEAEKPDVVMVIMLEEYLGRMKK